MLASLLSLAHEFLFAKIHVPLNQSLHKLLHQFSLRMARLHCEEHSNRDLSRLSLPLKFLRKSLKNTRNRATYVALFFI
ncbi:MAG: hypothetical protein E6852_05070 [Peptoniphilus harei]|nr:hypothetical protein [Peptoniphilus harei]